MSSAVKIVDSVMGSGKTTAAINYINSAPSDEKFIYVTPYLDEVERIIASCPVRDFVQPEIALYGSKKRHVIKLLADGRNIVTTHALFASFDLTFADVISRQGYTLILDETLSEIEELDATEPDRKDMLQNYLEFDDRGFAVWSDQSYTGKFTEYKNKCDLGGLFRIDDKLIMSFPYQIFESFKTSYVLTYMFEGQLLSLYLKFCGLKYEYYHVENFRFAEGYRLDNGSAFKNQIHICDNEKMNDIGRKNRWEINRNDTTLSYTWYARQKNTGALKELKNHCGNFYQNMHRSKSQQNLWTTFKEYKNVLKGYGYTKGFAPVNVRATNNFKDRKYVAYLVNRFINPNLKNCFRKMGYPINAEQYALSEMLQFIWRSAVREGQDIYLYVPSVRMRILLKEWLGVEDYEMQVERYGYSDAYKKSDRRVV